MGYFALKSKLHHLTWKSSKANDRLNRVFELNQLPYDGYPGQDDVDHRGKKPVVETKDDPAPAAAPSSKKRKLGIAMGGLGVSDGFARELMRTCAAPGERMSSPELRESSARMLKVTVGCWPRNVPIPRAASGDVFTSRMVRKWRVFPYGRNIAAVVSAVMDKDRQGASQKRQAAIRIVEARPKRQKRGSAKDAVPSGGKPPLAAKSGVPASSKAPEAAAGAGGSKPAKAVPPLSRVAEAAKAARALPSAGKRVADFATDICVEDYLGGKSLACVFFNSLVRCRVGRGPTCYGCACRGDRDDWHSAEGEGRGSWLRRRGVGPRGCQGRGGRSDPPAEGGDGGVESGDGGAESGPLSYTLSAPFFLRATALHVLCRWLTSPAVLRRGSSRQLCLPKSRDFGRNMLTLSVRNQPPTASAEN
jgi:hypothetical protein